MSKSKSKDAKGTKSDVLAKVKDAGISKPAQNPKAKSKELAKQVAVKEEKKNKKKPKEPTPEPSSEEESDASMASSSESEESDSEVETTKPAINGKTNGVKVAAKTDSSDESDDSEESESDSENEAPATNGAKITPAVDSDASDDSEDDSEAEEEGVDAEDSDDASSESDSEDEKPAQVSAAKPELTKATKKKVEPESESEEDSGSEEDSEDSGSEEDSEDSEESEAEVKTKTTKRKAEEEETPVTKKSKTELDTSRGANLFVGNLSWNVDEAWLKDEFSGYGELNGVRVMTDRQTGRSKGFAYVEFVDAADAAKAHADKQGAELDGRAMNVDFANARPTGDQKQDNRRKSYGDSVSEPSDTLFVGNLSFDVGQDAVSQAFAPHGTILGVRLPTDRETGQPKGFGYVTFASVEEAQTALEAMQGFYLEKRPVRLDYSQPRPPQGDSPARGGFGGRGRGGFGGDRGGGRGRGRGGGDFRGGRGGSRGGRGASTNRGGFGDFSGRKTTF